MRLAIVTNIPSPYRVALFDRVDELLRARGGRLIVIFGARSEPRSQWSDSKPRPAFAESIILSERPLRFRGRSTYVNPRVALVLQQTQPDAVVIGGYAPWTYIAATWCRSAGVPYLIWSAETRATAAALGSRRLRRLPLWRGAGGLLAYGPAAADYLADNGADRSAITILGNGIDIDAYSEAVEAARPERNTIRSQLGLSGRVILSVGGKGIDRVTTLLPEMRQPVQLAVAGGRGSTPPGVVELGRLPSEVMPRVYAAADCLVHLTDLDRWPHTINEALSGGLPVVASRVTGVPDSALVGPGCAIVGASKDELAAALERALHVSRSASADVREAIRAPLRPWSVPAMAERMVAAVESAGAA